MKEGSVNIWKQYLLYHRKKHLLYSIIEIQNKVKTILAAVYKSQVSPGLLNTKWPKLIYLFRFLRVMILLFCLYKYIVF